MPERVREIPYNYTSADDRQIVTHLLGEDVWERLETLRSHRVTGRSARLLMRFFGDLAVHGRNPFLYQELIDSSRRRRRFFGGLDTALKVVEEHAGESAVFEVLARCKELYSSFRDELEAAPGERARWKRVLGGVLGPENVLFDPFTLVSHATDATDWRLYLPLCVVVPHEEKLVAPLLRAIRDLGLHAIPRGAGTGLTGGAVPLRPRCVVVNTERLDRIHGIDAREFDQGGGHVARASVLTLEAGVLTEAAMAYASERGLVFATDPTSAWACTIGGNIAENAGGKTCVLYGTAIDNLVSFRIAMPTGEELTVRRLGHPLRKILPDDVVRFEVRDARGDLRTEISLRSEEIRKRGLWKDITNKTLGGVPGLQKEGTDGVITSAEFLLYPEYPHTATLCLEFFGPDMDEASQVIEALSVAMPNRGEEALRALEHFDDEYVRAIGYKTKALRGETPKAVIVIDLVGHTSAQVDRGVATVRRLVDAHANTFLFLAKTPEEATRFWADRKKLGAIAKRTNAFKLNEDVVLPLASLASFARFIAGLNLEEERHSQVAFLSRARDYLQSARPSEDPEWLSEKMPGVLSLLDDTRAALERAEDGSLRTLAIVTQLRSSLLDRVRGYAALEDGLTALFEEVRAHSLVVATHMHAGDGNVHVNIPVLSNDRAMMRRAEALVDRVMERVLALGGVVSGEHGIGITKLKYLEPARIEELESYRRRVDPDGVMNPGKLSDRSILEKVFTPSFNLLELEARILSHGSLEQLAGKIAKCVRCGRCKANCCVFYPARSLFFHPRNKNLAIGALVEALLYDAQRERSTGFELLRHLEEVADNCTICHKCAKPCPVKIDTGEVTVLERTILAGRRFKHTALATRLALGYLNSRSRFYNGLFRGLVLRCGSFAQRRSYRLFEAIGRARGLGGGRTVALLSSPLAAPDPCTLRDVLPACQSDQVLEFKGSEDPPRTVFYFPGCGSERMFSRVSMAALYLLLKQDTRVIVPPPFLCCGFPAYANARAGEHDRTVLRDSILFSQIREMFNYVAFDACVVTCGTCREALGAMGVESIFGCELSDLARYLIAHGFRAPDQETCLYHAPCHDSLDGQASELLVRAGGRAPKSVPHCCSEAGTLALSRPDIAEAMRHRKAAALKAELGEGARSTRVLTNCPSCLQGLARNRRLGVEPVHIAVDFARRVGGDGWEAELRELVRDGQAIHF